MYLARNTLCCYDSMNICPLLLINDRPMPVLHAMQLRRVSVFHLYTMLLWLLMLQSALQTLGGP